MNNDLVKLLNNLGLTEYQSKVFATLIAYGSLTAKNIAQKSGVPSPKVYAALADLEKKAIIAYHPSYPKRYSVSNTELILRRLLDGKKEIVYTLAADVEDKIKNLDKYKKSMPHNVEEECIWVSRGYKEALLRAADTVKNAKTEILMVTGTFKLSSALSIALKKAIKLHKVTVRVIGPKVPNTEKNIKQYLKIGAKVKTVKFDNECPRMLLIDKKFSALRIGPNSIQLMVNNPGFNEINRSYFMTLWNSGTAASP